MIERSLSTAVRVGWRYRPGTAKMGRTQSWKRPENDRRCISLPMNPQFFCDLEVRRTRAIVERDLEAIEALHAPEYQLITPSGRSFSRTRYLEMIKAAPFYAAWEH